MAKTNEPSKSTDNIKKSNLLTPRQLAKQIAPTAKGEEFKRIQAATEKVMRINRGRVVTIGINQYPVVTGKVDKLKSYPKTQNILVEAINKELEKGK